MAAGTSAAAAALQQADDSDDDSEEAAPVAILPKIPRMSRLNSPAPPGGKRRQRWEAQTPSGGQDSHHLLLERSLQLPTELSLEPQHGPNNTEPQVPGDSEISKNLETVGHLVHELDGLFASMGRAVLTVPAGKRTSLQVLASTLRTVEVRMPKPEEGKVASVQLNCGLEARFNASNDFASSKRQPSFCFDVSVADTQRLAATHQWRVRSVQKTAHRLQFVTDFPSIFVTLWSTATCQIEVMCRVGHVSNLGAMDNQSEASEEFDFSARSYTGITKSLAAKLRLRRQELTEAEQLQGPVRAVSATSVTPMGRRRMSRSRTFGEYVFEGIAAPRSDDETREAQLRVLRLWPGRFTDGMFGRVVVDPGPWVQALSPDCPRNLIRWLRKGAQERSCLISVAMVGAFDFFYRRQRELHLMRVRAALRHLLWAKTVYAAIACRLQIAFVVKGRQVRRQQQGVDVMDRSGREAAIRSQIYKITSKFGPVQIVNPRTARRTLTPATAAVAAVELQSQEQHQQLQQQQQQQQHQPWSETLERRLAAQGFTVRPRPRSPGRARAEPGALTSRRRRLSLQTRQSLLMHELSRCLGREVELDMLPSCAALPSAGPSGSVMTSYGSSATDSRMEVAPNSTLLQTMREVSARTLVVTVGPGEQPNMEETSGGCRKTNVEKMSTLRFKHFHHSEAQRIAEVVMQRRADLAEEESGVLPVVVRIVKRYNLRFFDDRKDLGWLPILQSLLLVIQGYAPFQSHTEHFLFDEKLRSFKEARKLALRKPGAFAPLEAALWSHPNILQLAMSMQRATLHRESATSWKGEVFEGSQALCSGRDFAGACLASAKPVGGNSQLLLRKATDVSGQFELCGAGAVGGCASPPVAELTPCQPSFFATKTPSGCPVRSFGDGWPPDHHLPVALLRQTDATLQLPSATGEQAQRLETLRLQRRERDGASLVAAGRPPDRELLFDSSIKAQRRYGSWMMASEIPESSRRFKDRLQPFFEQLIVTERQATETENTTPRLRPAGNVNGDGATPTSFPQVAGAGIRTSAADASIGGGSGGTVLSLPPTLPRTTDEVGQMVERSDALATILDLNREPPAGGEPSRLDKELRRARLIEKAFSTPKRPALELLHPCR